MKFKLVEELLLEKKWYHVSFNVNSSNQPRTGYMYLDNDESSAKVKANKLLKSQSYSEWKEFITQQYWPNIHNYFNGYVPDSVKILEADVDYSKVREKANLQNDPKITDWDRVMRRKTHSEVSKGQFASVLADAGVNIEDSTIHHIDGDEENTDHKNLVIIPHNGNGQAFGNKLHQILHTLQWDPNSSSPPYTFYTLDIVNGVPKAIPHFIT